MGSPIDTAALKEELKQTKHQLALFHDSWKQAKQACEAWKKEAEGATKLEAKLRDMESKVRALQSQGPFRVMAEGADIVKLPLSKLEQIQHQLKSDLGRIEVVRVLCGLYTSRFILIWALECVECFDVYPV